MKKIDHTTGRRFNIAGLLLTLSILSGCGLKDDLYIPTEEDVTANDEQSQADKDAQTQNDQAVESAP